jgi:CRP-like cAMP-binding protein
MAIRVEQLKQIALFGNTEANKLKEISSRAGLIRLENGAVLYRQGDVSDRAYVVLNGSVCIYLEGDDQDIVLETVGRGQLLGYATALSGLRRAVSATAVGAVDLIAFSAEDIARVLEE